MDEFFFNYAYWIIGVLALLGAWGVAGLTWEYLRDDDE